jgi:predicted transposase YbfD/YdcC
LRTPKERAKRIIDENANYILAVKPNQPQLLEHLKDEFRFSKQPEIYTKHDLDQGSIETRTCSLITDFMFIEQNNQWKNMTNIIKVDSIRESKNSDNVTEKAIRYYISNLRHNASEFQSKVGSHGAVENKLHWTLDVAFCEDASRKRARNATQNYSILLKIALNLLKNKTSKKLSIKS